VSTQLSAYQTAVLMWKWKKGDYNERERETDWQKWIIRTESFTAVSDTDQRNKDIKFHCKVFSP